MDAAAAIGLAGNIVQFIDFSWKIFQGSKDLYKSSTGASAENDVLELISRDLSYHTQRLDAITERHVTIPDSLISLIYECNKVADRLMKTLDTIKVRSPHKKWESFIQALHCIWKKDKIQGFVRQLERLRNELQFTLQIMLR